MTPVPDFPSELVEAAAVVCYSLAPEHDTSTYPHGYVPYDEARPSSCENARADALEVLTALYPLIEQRARLDERERLSSRVHENGWCPTCARDTDEAAMQRLAGKSLESLSRNDLIGLALRNLNAAMDAEPRADAAEQRVIDRLAGEAGRASMTDPFPNELVEAVEEACTIIENRCGTVRGIGPAMREALSVVVPLIEQRVIERLADRSGTQRAWQHRRSMAT